MEQFKRVFVYSNIFIAVCAAVMVFQTYRFLLDAGPDMNLIWFVFSGTMCSYSFHWFLPTHEVRPSVRNTWSRRNRIVLWLLFLGGLAGSVISFIPLSAHWPWLLGAVFPTFLYSAPKLPFSYTQELRKLAAGKTFFLALVWTYVTTVLPVIISPAEWTMAHLLFVLSRFFLIYAICILFDYRDREDDRYAGIHSQIAYLSEGSITRMFSFSLLLFAAVTIGLAFSGYAWISVLILLLPGLIVAALYDLARRNFSDTLYYFILDGLMAFSAFLMLIPGI